MKDIPIFTTENGAASLSLQQIPYSGFAHITIHSTSVFDAFLEECAGFCRAVGAKHILACGHNDLERYPVYTSILRMQLTVPADIDAAWLFPVTEESFDTWLDIYNSAMRNVPNAVILSKQMGLSYMEKKMAYFAHRGGEILGIGIVEEDIVRSVVSCKEGAGEIVMKTLFGAVIGDTVKVEVAENNLPAMNLYRRLGFVPTGILKVWYDITKIF